MRTNAELKSDICARTEKLTMPMVWHRNAAEYGDRPALTAGKTTVTWSQFRDEVAAMARGLEQLGLRRRERMLIMMNSRIEHWVVDAAATHVGAVSCTAYRTLSAEQMAAIARHSRATVVVLENADDVARWAPMLGALPSIKKVLVVEPDARIEKNDSRFVSWQHVLATGRALHAEDSSVFENGWRSIRPDDPLTLMYTSGTTGEPKGVVLSHRNALYEAVAIDAVVPVDSLTRSIAYLPLAHIAERELGIYRAAYKALHVTICSDPTQVVPSLPVVRPPTFFGVPRVWEKIAAGLRARVATLDGAKQTVILDAHAVAAELFRLTGEGLPVPEELRQKAALAETHVLRPLRAMLGLDSLEWASSGSAPIPVEVLHYLGGFGIHVFEVWGMSETTGCATLNTPDDFRLGAVGKPVPGVEVKLAADGEIFVRGPILFLGYLNADGDIESPVDAEGWLATGDVGTIDKDGFLRITDRKKELIITSQGKNIAPSQIEGLIRTHPLVGHALVIGDRRPYVTALVALDPEGALAWARAKGLEGLSIAELAAHDRVRSELNMLIESVNARLSRPEQVKRFEVVSDTWLPGSAEITPTMKLRRAALTQRYEARISAMYAE